MMRHLERVQRLLGVGALAVLHGALVTAPASAQLRPITHEDVFLAKRPDAPVLSPDGRWAVVSVTEPAYAAPERASHLWLVPTDGSAEPRRLTSLRGSESGAAWSPDGRKLAFSARREGDDAAQIYVLDLGGGGEAQRLTALSTGASSPVWSPDGRYLLFNSTVHPDGRDDAANRRIAAERRDVKHSARVYDGFPIRFWDRWLDDRRSTLLVQEAVAGAAPRDLLAGTRLIEEPGFAGVPGQGTYRVDGAWTPDGRGVVFVASTDRHTLAHSFTTTHLFHVALDGGEPRQLTRGADSYRSPKFSPDGRRLYAQVSPGGRVYTHNRLAVLDWPAAGEPRVLTAGFDRSVASFALAPDGRAIYLLAEDRGHDRVYTMPASGGPVRELTGQRSGAYGGLAVAGARQPVIVALWQSAVQPPDVVRIDARSGQHSPLTRFNAEIAAAIDWQPVQEFWFTSSRGREIHNFLVLPPGFDPNRRYPLLVLMHGGPHSAWKDQFHTRWNYHLLGGPGYVVLLTNFTGSTGFAESFAQAIEGDPLRGPADEINEAADEAIRRYAFIDGSRQAAAGASYGGHLAYWMQGVTDRYRTLVAHAGAMNMEAQWGTSDVIYHREVNFLGPVWEQGEVWRDQNPIRHAANFRTPMLLTVGERDYRVPLNTTIEAWNVLQRLQIPSRLIVFPDENHWILGGENSRFFYQEVHDWLARFVGERALGAEG